MKRTYRERQYISILFYHDEQQKEIIVTEKKKWEEIKQGDIQTVIAPFSSFTNAEDYHQKYYLKRYATAVEPLKQLFHSHEEFKRATLTARLNGIAKGFGKMSELITEIDSWGLTSKQKEKISETIAAIRW